MSSKHWGSVTGLLPGEVEKALKDAAMLHSPIERLKHIEATIAFAKMKYPEFFRSDKDEIAIEKR